MAEPGKETVVRLPDDLRDGHCVLEPLSCMMSAVSKVNFSMPGTVVCVVGELGHIPMMGREERCGCGNIGCIENYGSGKYLERMAGERFTGVPIKRVFREKRIDQIRSIEETGRME